MSKIIRVCIGFSLLLPVIGLENTPYPFHQSDGKLEPVTSWSPTCSRAVGRLVVITLSSRGLFRVLVFYFPRTGRCDFFLVNDTQSKSALLSFKLVVV